MFVYIYTKCETNGNECVFVCYRDQFSMCEMFLLIGHFVSHSSISHQFFFIFFSLWLFNWNQLNRLGICFRINGVFEFTWFAEWIWYICSVCFIVDLRLFQLHKGIVSQYYVTQNRILAIIEGLSSQTRATLP